MKESLKKEFKTFIEDKVTIGCFIGIIIIALIGGAAYQYSNRVPDGYIRINDEDYNIVTANEEESIDNTKNLYIANYIVDNLKEIDTDFNFELYNREHKVTSFRYTDAENSQYILVIYDMSIEDNFNNKNNIFIIIDNKYAKIVNNDTSCYVRIDTNNIYDSNFSIKINNVEPEMIKSDFIDSDKANIIIDDTLYAKQIYDEYKDKFTLEEITNALYTKE